jgi:hypothetical protein
LSYARILFWPHFQDGREPDLLVLLGKGPEDLAVALMVEAKLYATQHEIAHGDAMLCQIAYYMIQHLQGAYGDGIDPNMVPAVRPLLFITRDQEIPRGELARARKEVLAALPGRLASDAGFFWCSWHFAAQEAHRLWRRHHSEVREKPWVRLLLDLWQDLAHRDLTPRDPFTLFPRFLGRLPSGLYREREWSWEPTVGMPPASVYARRDPGISAWTKAKQFGALPYLQGR